VKVATPTSKPAKNIWGSLALVVWMALVYVFYFGNLQQLAFSTLRTLIRGFLG
jgi:dolichol kinase